MRELLNIVEAQSPFVQSLIASVVFAIILYVSQLVLVRLKRAGQFTVRFFAKDMLLKHWVHKNYVSNPNALFTIIGHIYIVTESFRWVIRSALVITFFLGVSSIVQGNWLWVIASWISFNYLFEADRWLDRNWSDDKEINFISEDIKKEFYASVSPQQASNAIEQKSEKAS